MCHCAILLGLKFELLDSNLGWDEVANNLDFGQNREIKTVHCWGAIPNLLFQ